MLKFLKHLIFTRGSKDSSKNEHPPLPYLSPELWEHIFLRLPRGQLLRLRQTCHYWKNIIDNCPAFRERFHVKLPQDDQMARLDQHYGPKTVPAGNVTFEFYGFSVISSVDPWWLNVGAVVSKLCLGRCEFPLEVLEHAPNLKSLHLFYVKLVEPKTTDFKLNKMQELALEYVDPDILRTLAKIIPSLKIFKFNGAVMDVSEEAEEEREVLKCVAEQLDMMERRLPKWNQAVQASWHSLKWATLNPTLFGETCFFGVPQIIRRARLMPTVRELEAIRGLRDISGEELISFVEHYPDLKEVSLVNCEAVEDTVVEVVCQNLTNLKKFILKNCNTTGESAEHIMKYCGQLNHLEVKERWKINKSQFEYFLDKLTILAFDHMD